MYNAFSFLYDYMAKHCHFHMFVPHVKRTWQKQACIKMKDLALCNNVL